MISKYFSVNVVIFSYPSVLTFVCAAPKNRLSETILLIDAEFLHEDDL